MITARKNNNLEDQERIAEALLVCPAALYPIPVRAVQCSAVVWLYACCVHAGARRYD